MGRKNRFKDGKKSVFYRTGIQRTYVLLFPTVRKTLPLGGERQQLTGGGKQQLATGGGKKTATFWWGRQAANLGDTSD